MEKLDASHSQGPRVNHSRFILVTLYLLCFSYFANYNFTDLVSSFYHFFSYSKPKKEQPKINCQSWVGILKILQSFAGQMLS